MTTETNARDRFSTPHVGRREELRLLLSERRQELAATLHDRIETYVPDIRPWQASSTRRRRRRLICRKRSSWP